jgi:hypothetical protein
MFSLLLIITVCVCYYFLNMYYPRENKEKIYFGIFIACWVILIYLLNFQKGLMYRIFKQIYNIENKPLYDISDFKKDNSQNEFKLTILQSQGSRCGKCMNFILPSKLDHTSMVYKVSPENGGEISHDNLMIICPSCQNYF